MKLHNPVSRLNTSAMICFVLFLFLGACHLGNSKQTQKVKKNRNSVIEGPNSRIGIDQTVESNSEGQTPSSIVQIVKEMHLGNFQDRDPDPNEVQYYNEAIQYVDGLPQTVAKATRKKTRRVLLFLKSLFNHRASFLENAAIWQSMLQRGIRPQLGHWYSPDPEVRNMAVFHQEAVAETGGDKNFTMRAKLNYIHNSWLKAYILSREAKQLPSFMNNDGIHGLEWCIDARTRKMNDTFMPHVENDFKFYRNCPSLEDGTNGVYVRMLQIHQVEYVFSGKGSEIDRNTFREFLEAQRGLKWGVANHNLPENYVEEAIEFAAMILAWD